MALVSGAWMVPNTSLREDEGVWPCYETFALWSGYPSLTSLAGYDAFWDTAV